MDQERAPPRKIDRCEHLTWYLHNADAAMGLRSSFGPMVDLALGGFGGSSGSHDGGAVARHDRRAEVGGGGAVDLGRRLRERWMRLDPQTQRVLWLAYGPHAWSRWSKDVARALGELSGVALLTHAAERGSIATAKTKAESLVFWRQERAHPDSDRLVWVPTIVEADTVTDHPVATWLARQCLRHQDVSAIRDEATRMTRAAFAEWLLYAAPKPRRMRAARPVVEPLAPRAMLRLIDPEED